MTHQLTIEGNAVIQDMELENIQLRDDLELVRNILGETDPQDDDDNMSALRQMMQNDSDTEN